jgi:hypothetical protein
MIVRKVGQVYLGTGGFAEPLCKYVLAQVDESKVALIALCLDANRYSDAVYVKDINNISQSEWDEITSYGEFSYLTEDAGTL